MFSSLLTATYCIPTMRLFAATIRAFGRSTLPGTSTRSVVAPSSSTFRNFGLQRYHTAQQSSNTALPAGALVASVIITSSILSQESSNQSQSAQCSTLPTPSTSQSTESTASALAEPVKDINTIYKLGEVIGEGGYGQVFYATRIGGDMPVALKCIPKEWTNSDDFKREVDVLRKLNFEDGGHPHICRMYDIYETEDEFWMGLELLEGGELFEHLIEEGAYSEAKAAVFLRQFAEALAFMHKSGGEWPVFVFLRASQFYNLFPHSFIGSQ